MIAAWIIAEAPGTVKTVIGFFAKGGLFMWPLLACSIVSVTTMILRGFALREKNVMPLVIESEIERLVPGGSVERLMRIVCPVVDIAPAATRGFPLRTSIWSAAWTEPRR